MATKQCTKCKQVMDVSNFYRSSRNKDGYKESCKRCRSSSQEAYEMSRVKERNRELLPQGRKICQQCKQEKDVSQFYVKKNSNTGYRSICIECEMVNICGKDKREKFITQQKEDKSLLSHNKLRCLKCNTVKLLTDFYRRNGEIRRPCKECYKNHQHDAYHKDIEASRRDGRAKRRDNPEKYSAISKRYGATDKGKVSRRERDMRRRAHELGAPSESHRELLTKIKEAGLFKCHYCHLMFAFDDLHLDHYIPISHPDGTDLNDNIVPACQHCNQSKGDKHPDDFDTYADDVLEIQNQP